MSIKVGVFVDADNVRFNGGHFLRYDVLRYFADRGQRQLIHLNTYITYDEERARDDPDYAEKAAHYQQSARQLGWKVNIKPTQRYLNNQGETVIKGNNNLSMTVDALQQADHLDEILLVTGDSDFCTLINALRTRGCRVELIGFDYVSRDLQLHVDQFYSGFLIPDLIPIAYETKNQWGKPNSCVRGVCSKWFPDKGYGFLSFLDDISDYQWIINSRLKESPWRSTFCHINEVATEVTEDDLNDGNTVLEFYLKESPQEENGLIAQNVRLVQA